MPLLGPDIFDPRQVQLIKSVTLAKPASDDAGDAKQRGDGAARSETAAPATISDAAKARMEQAKARAAAKKASA